MNGSLALAQMNSVPDLSPLAPVSALPIDWPIELVLMIGVPGSGKSTWARQLQQLQSDCLIVSTDRIRAMLFGDETIQGSWFSVQREIRQQLQQAVIQIRGGQARLALYDATNTKRRYRRDLIALVRSIGFTHITAVWLHPPLELCLLRNQGRSRQVPEAVIHRMDRQLWSCPPRLREGIDRLLYNPEPVEILTDMQPNQLSLTRIEGTEIAPASRQEPNPIGR